MNRRITDARLVSVIERIYLPFKRKLLFIKTLFLSETLEKIKNLAMNSDSNRMQSTGILSNRNIASDSDVFQKRVRTNHLCDDADTYAHADTSAHAKAHANTHSEAHADGPTNAITHHHTWGKLKLNLTFN